MKTALLCIHVLWPYAEQWHNSGCSGQLLLAEQITRIHPDKHLLRKKYLTNIASLRIWTIRSYHAVLHDGGNKKMVENWTHKSTWRKLRCTISSLRQQLKFHVLITNWNLQWNNNNLYILVKDIEHNLIYMSSYHKIWDGLSGAWNKSINYISITGLKDTIPKEQIIYDDKPKTSRITYCKTSATLRSRQYL